MTLLRSIAMAFSTFSALPMPSVRWKDENMRYMLAALPLVGLAVGLVLWGWLGLCNALRFGDNLFAAGVALLPTLVTGGIHMDGFCDTVDALNSHAPPARKLEILKDPHPGAFAVIYVCAYLLGYFALATQLPRTTETMWLLAFLHMTSRAAGALAALSFPLAGGDGLLFCTRQAAVRPAVAICATELALCAAGMGFVLHWKGLAMAAAVALCMGYVRRMSVRQFSGMRGDLVGYLITVSELAMLAAMILITGVTGK